MSLESNSFTPEQLKQLSELKNNKVELKQDVNYEKTYTKTKEAYALKGIYLLEFEDGMKIGMSANIKRRIKDYEKPWCKPILNKIFFYYEDFQDLELEILRKSKKYVDFTVNSNEWITGISFEKMVINMDKIIRIRDCQNQNFKAFIENNL